LRLVQGEMSDKSSHLAAYNGQSHRENRSIKTRDRERKKTGELQKADRKDKLPDSLRITLYSSAWLACSSPVYKSPV